MKNKKRLALSVSKGFTLIELLIIVAIIGILATVILTLWSVSSQKAAAINAYKTSMNSVRTAIELCDGAGSNSAISGAPGDPICVGSEKYPTITSKCGSINLFTIAYVGNNWSVTTDSCKGCKLICDVEKCVEATPGTCS